MQEHVLVRYINDTRQVSPCEVKAATDVPCDCTILVSPDAIGYNRLAVFVKNSINTMRELVVLVKLRFEKAAQDRSLYIDGSLHD